MVVVEVRLWVGFGLEWTGNGLGRLALDWIGSRRGLWWVRFNVQRTAGHPPPFRLWTAPAGIDGCDVMGRNGRFICGSEHARHRSTR